MTRFTCKINLPVMILATILGTILTYEAIGVGRAMLATPTAVATVDLGRLLEGLEQRAAAQKELDALRTELTSQVEQFQSDFEARRTQWEAETDPARRQQLEDELTALQIEAVAWQRLAGEKADIAQSTQFQKIYRDIVQAIEDLARIEGYELVIVDDSGEEIRTNPQIEASRRTQVQQQILSRRILYRAESIDITDELITRMNNTFASGGGS